MAEFTPFPSIARLTRDMIVTEKIDGTNAQIAIDEEGNVRAGSRNRWITPEQDNFGFARWVEARKDDIRAALGPGQHFGEWWGQGIQRGYGLTEKRFSLFNVGRWEHAELPDFIHVVPVLQKWTFDTEIINAALCHLEEFGSIAAPGFMKPEGIVVFHTKANVLFKKTLDKHDGHKGGA